MRSIPPHFATGENGCQAVQITAAGLGGRKEALAEIEAHLPAGFVLAVGFNAFGQRGEAQIADHLHERRHELLPLGVALSMSRISDMSNFT